MDTFFLVTQPMFQKFLFCSRLQHRYRSGVWYWFIFHVYLILFCISALNCFIYSPVLFYWQITGRCLPKAIATSSDLGRLLLDCRFPFKAHNVLWPTGGLRLKWGVCFVCMCYETTIQRYFYRPKAELCIFIKALRITEMPSKWVCCAPV